ncbi:MAG: inositol monophosphatase family protein [Gammaproteobacteria bacterium]
MFKPGLDAARKGASILKRAFLTEYIQNIPIETKGPTDYVTEIDRKIQHAVFSELAKFFPDHSFKGEENLSLDEGKGKVEAEVEAKAKVEAEAEGDGEIASEGAGEDDAEIASESEGEDDAEIASESEGEDDAEIASAEVESEGEELVTTQSDFVWILDPLDGTTNFIHDFPHFAVSLALEIKGRTEFAYIIDPCREEVYTAQRGKGAFCNDRRIRASDQEGLKDSLLANSSRDVQFYGHNNIGTMQELYENELTVRRTGSAALDMAYVAAGRLDGFWASGLKHWDLSAGLLLIQEAGGIVEGYRSDDSICDTGAVIAATNGCFSGLAKSVRNHLDEKTLAQAVETLATQQASEQEAATPTRLEQFLRPQAFDPSWEAHSTDGSDRPDSRRSWKDEESSGRRDDFRPRHGDRSDRSDRSDSRRPWKDDGGSGRRDGGFRPRSGPSDRSDSRRPWQGDGGSGRRDGGFRPRSGPSDRSDSRRPWQGDGGSGRRDGGFRPRSGPSDRSDSRRPWQGDGGSGRRDGGFRPRSGPSDQSGRSGRPEFKRPWKNEKGDGASAGKSSKSDNSTASTKEQTTD